MRSFKSFLKLTIFSSIGYAIGYYYEIFYIITIIVTIIGVLIIFADSETEIIEYNHYKEKLDQLQNFMKQQGYKISDAQQEVGNVTQIKYKINISYVNDKEEVIRDAVIASLSSDIDISNNEDVHKALLSNRHIYNLPIKFNVVFVEKNQNL